MRVQTTTGSWYSGTIKTLTQLAQLVNLHWKPCTSFDLKVVYMENGEVAAKIGDRTGVGATVQEAVDALCSSSSPQSLMSAILRAHNASVDATMVDLEAAKKAVFAAEKKLADKKAALQRLQDGVFSE